MKWFTARNVRSNEDVFIKATPQVNLLHTERESNEAIQHHEEKAPSLQVRVPRIHAWGKANRLHYLAFEKLNGWTLQELKLACRVNDPRFHGPLTQGLVECLLLLEEAGVIHRDLHENNLFLTDEDPVRLVLLDLGSSILPNQSNVDVFMPSRLVRLAQKILKLHPPRWDDAQMMYDLFKRIEPQLERPHSDTAKVLASRIGLFTYEQQNQAQV